MMNSDGKRLTYTCHMFTPESCDSHMTFHMLITWHAPPTSHPVCNDADWGVLWASLPPGGPLEGGGLCPPVWASRPAETGREGALQPGGKTGHGWPLHRSCEWRGSGSTLLRSRVQLGLLNQIERRLDSPMSTRFVDQTQVQLALTGPSENGISVHV